MSALYITIKLLNRPKDMTSGCPLSYYSRTSSGSSPASSFTSNSSFRWLAYPLQVRLRDIYWWDDSAELFISRYRRSTDGPAC
ncbi:hypothetical protein PILCRDRAFT_453937 [Piloderma croceum F 1598]|uniref:Uncharacterized protein n=1 Tax=Piloderma croceum (strain F 1598) TaxID=765440 RepID=A0A0C3FE41_PILCF|nr:hypothetical protein PILCRDRAFT_453937 [Piloderma croceum F 1598]